MAVKRVDKLLEFGVDQSKQFVRVLVNDRDLLFLLGEPRFQKLQCGTDYLISVLTLLYLLLETKGLEDRFSLSPGKKRNQGGKVARVCRFKCAKSFLMIDEYLADPSAPETIGFTLE